MRVAKPDNRALPRYIGGMRILTDIR